MNWLQFQLLRLFALIGYRNDRMRMNQISRASHRLEEAEIYIGRRAWEHLEEVEPISTDYWELKHLNSQEKKVEEGLRGHTEKVQALQERHELEHRQFEEALVLLENERYERSRSLNELAGELNLLQREAKEIERKVRGAGKKIQVLTEEEAPQPVLGKAKEELIVVEKNYGHKQDEVDSKLRQLGAEEDDLKELEGRITALKQESARRLGRINAELARSSKSINEMNAKRGGIRTSRLRHERAIGRYVLDHGGDCSPDVAHLLRDQSVLVNRANQFKRTIRMNQSLLDKT